MCLRITFLGTGSSIGTPRIGCDCAVCREALLNPASPNRRLRAALLVQSERTTLLVDAGPDLHEQALRHRLRRVDAVLFTHEHMDHTAGFDELRAFCWFREDDLPLWAGAHCMAELQRVYPWAFAAEKKARSYIRPQAHVHSGAPFRVGDIDITPVPVFHSSIETYGYVFRSGGRSFGYVPDIKELPPESRPLLSGLDGLALSALAFEEYRSHLNVAECVALMQELRPTRGWLTHIIHDAEHHRLQRALPAGLAPAYDGLQLCF